MLTTCNLTQKNGIKINGRSLDLVISNVNIVVKRIEEKNLIIKEDKGHPALELEINKSDIKFLHSIKTEKINFFNANYEQINNEIRQIDWHSALQSHNIDDAVNIFYDKIHTIIKKNAQIIRPKSDLYPKWYSENLIQMIKDKNYYRNKMKAANGEFYITLFQLKRKEIKREKRKCLKNYIASIEPMVQSNPKSFFAYTKAQKQNNRLPAAMFYRNTLAENMDETANIFADYFSSVYVNNSNSFEINVTNQNPNDFRISSQTISNIISEINIFKTNSPDGIPGIFYKKTAETIVSPLLISFTNAINSMI